LPLEKQKHDPDHGYEEGQNLFKAYTNMCCNKNLEKIKINY